MREERYPRIRHHMSNGFLIIRDGVVMTFFIQRHHREISANIRRALDLYRRTVGEEKLRWYTHAEGESQPLDADGWSFIHEKLRSENGWPVDLWESDTQVGDYRFEYRGRALGTDSYQWSPHAVSAVSFWLPMEYLEEQGPARVRALALALARELPFNTGYASPAFNTLTDELGVDRILLELSTRSPGMDILDIGMSMRIGTRPKGTYWLNFYGQPLLDELGGAAGLRERLTLPEISVEESQPDKVLVQLGEWPEVDGEMRAYRQLARVLEPYLYQETIPVLPAEEMRRWERRFLD
jgi:hypothetical protein